jgi:hypothetical protein
LREGVFERYVAFFSAFALHSPYTFSTSRPSRFTYTACAALGFVGISGLGGGLSEYFSSPASYLHKLPDNVSLKAGAMAEPLAVAVHAVKRSGFKEGMTALVVGAGAIGCFISKVLVAQGASCVPRPSLYAYPRRYSLPSTFLAWTAS